MRSLMGMSLVGIVMGLPAAPSAAAQSRPPDVGPGRIAWFDLTTSNLARSREFYGTLFGWTFRPVPGSDQAVEIVSGGVAIGTLRVAEGPVSAFNGVVYIQVADMRAALATARQLGGTIPPGFPFELSGGAGTVGLVLDRSGHPVGLYSAETSQAPPAAEPRPPFS